MRSLGAHIEPPFRQVAGVDQWYNSMPLYHGTGAITSMSGLLGGISLAIAPRFSVSNFWPDVHASRSTFFIYVGETARYLLNAPPHPLERSHILRCGYGNGLRPDVWVKFQERFNIPQIAEFFNSTEGMLALLNYNTGPFSSACVGHHGLILRGLLHNVYVPVRIDHESGDIYRDPKTGFAQRCDYDTGGEILVAVPNKEAFQGYWRSEEATAKRFAENVFKKGDVFYRSGDALRRDGEGRWYFLDRLGDTFRWKSENVSTAEVAECLGKFPGVAEANVYGVVVPGHEGRAGCAALHLEPGVDGDLNGFLEKMRAHAVANLPKYAVPVFLRLVARSTHIHNHKQNKVPLRKEGVDPSLVGSEAPEGKGDRFFWLDPRRRVYVPFGTEEWAALERGESKL
jgi:acyl-CoA synthetase (AMP-forming)/AMP-acid ligase II